MPNQELIPACIKCGKPSDTVVCMNCFFKYEHQSYEPEERALVAQAFVCCDDFEKEFNSQGQTDPQDIPSVLLWDEGELFDEPEEPTEPVKPPEPKKNASVSWFSRLPRF